MGAGLSQEQFRKITYNRLHRAGLSQEQFRKITYNRLQSVKRQLLKFGVADCRYCRGQLSGTIGHHSYSVSFGPRLYASNGETCAFLQVYIDGTKQKDTNAALDLLCDMAKTTESQSV